MHSVNREEYAASNHGAAMPLPQFHPCPIRMATFPILPKATEKGNKFYGRNQCWRYRLGVSLVSARDAHDPWPSAILRWAGAPEECALDDYAQLLYAWADQRVL